MRRQDKRSREAPIAPPSEVREILAELHGRHPLLFPSDEAELRQLLNAVRHFESRDEIISRKGRPGRWDRETLRQASNHVKAELERRYNRLSIGTFVSFCLPTLDYPSDIVNALEAGEINRQEAALLARLTAERMQLSKKQAAAKRREVIRAHIDSDKSQNSLRDRVREILGESAVITSVTSVAEVMTAVDKVDQFLAVFPDDLRGPFFDGFKDVFIAMREFGPDDLTLADIEELMVGLDLISNTIHKIKREIERRNRPPQSPSPAPGQRPTVEQGPDGQISYRFDK